MDDGRLLADFVSTQLPAPFAELVRRHVGLVYAAAMRQVRDHHLAEEITQSVFVLLSRKAASHKGECAIAGWLLKTTRFVALDALKLRERRRRHERGAAAMHVEQSTNPGPLDIASHAEMVGALDDGLLALKTLDRRAILMRFYESKTFEDVGRHMGIDAEAARKRVGRAVERLRDYFIRRGGKAATTVAIVALLGMELRAEAPPQVAARAVRFACDGGNNVLVNTVNQHLWRINLLRWSLGVAGFITIWLSCAGSLRPVSTLAASFLSRSTSSSEASAN